MSKQPSITIYIDRRRKLTSGTYPLKITVYHDHQKRRYDTGYSITESDWTRLNADKLRDDGLRLLKRQLNAKVEYALSIIETLSPFTFSQFAELYSGKAERQKQKVLTAALDLESAFNIYIEQLESDDRFGSAEIYVTARNSILKFRPAVKLSDVNLAFLTDYERHLRSRNTSPSTIGIYMRHLRAIINLAIKDGRLKRENYAFVGYTIPSSRNVKKALDNNEILALLGYSPADDGVAEALDYWKFSYFCNGMNMKDVCLLKWSNIKGETMDFFRAKTVRTKKRDLRPIKVHLNQHAFQIIKRRSAPKSAGYVFPILQESMTARQIEQRVKSFIKGVNKGMKTLKADLGIASDTNTYAARHTFATVLKRKGFSTELIKDSLGHSSLSTTENYLDDFSDDLRKSASEMLTKF